MATTAAKWENRLGPLTLLLTFVVLSTLPFLNAGLLGGRPLASYVSTLGELLTSHRFREITGYLALALILFEILYSIRKRTKAPIPIAKKGMRSVHMIIGAALVPLILIHTGGHWGANLNGWLQISLLLVILVGVAGKYVDVVRKRQLKAMTPDKLDDPKALRRAANRARIFHCRWLKLHVVLVSALLVLVAFHVLAVYYF